MPTEEEEKIHIVKRYKKKFKLIDESYNANPISKKKLKILILLKKINLKNIYYLVICLSLGKKSEVLHKDLSRVINNSNIDKVFVKGNKTLFTTYKNIHKVKRGNIFQ